MIRWIRKYWRTRDLRSLRRQLRRMGFPSDQLGIMSMLNEMIDHEMSPDGG